VVEDCAQAHGARYKGRPVGSLGHAAAFSFCQDKIMTSGGEGGAVVTEDDALAARMRRIRHHGEGPVEGERAYYHVELGYNYRMTSMQAATGLVQLRRLDGYLEARRRNAAYLTERLPALGVVEPPAVAPYAVHSYYKYICRLPSGAPAPDIEGFVRAVTAEGVPIQRRYPTPLPRQPVFATYGAVPCPVADRLAGELLTLLVHPTLTTADLRDYVRAIEKVAGAYRRR
jgi:perosamine synthetase